MVYCPVIKKECLKEGCVFYEDGKCLIKELIKAVIKPFTPPPTVTAKPRVEKKLHDVWVT